MLQTTNVIRGWDGWVAAGNNAADPRVFEVFRLRRQYCNAGGSAGRESVTCVRPWPKAASSY